MKRKGFHGEINDVEEITGWVTVHTPPLIGVDLLAPGIFLGRDDRHNERCCLRR